MTDLQKANEELFRINAEFARRMDELISCMENFFVDPENPLTVSRLFHLCGWMEGHAEIKNKVFYAGQNKRLLEFEMIAEKLSNALFDARRTGELDEVIASYGELVDYEWMDDWPLTCVQ